MSHNLQELAQRFRELGSPEMIAAYVLGIHHNLEAENQELRLQNFEMGRQIAEVSIPATTFTCFSKLPPEIRVRIWRYAEPAAKIVMLENKNRATKVRASNKGLLGLELVCPKNHHPSILHVSSEARTELLKVHPLQPERPGGIPRFFNHFQDVLLIDPRVFDDLMRWDGNELTVGEDRVWHGSADLARNLEVNPAGFDPSKIRRIAIYMETWRKFTEILINQLINFPLLEELILMYDMKLESYNSVGGGRYNVIDLQGWETVWVSNQNGPMECWTKHSYEECVKGGFEVEFVDFSAEWQGIHQPPADKQKNLWLAAGRPAPRIRIMRLIEDTVTRRAFSS